MWLSLVLCFAGALVSAEIPQDQTYKITLTDGQTLYGFVDMQDWTNPKVSFFEIRMDSFPQGQVEKFSKSKIRDIVPELPSLREKRRTEQHQKVVKDLENAGYEIVAGQAVPKTDKEWADRARKLAGLPEWKQPGNEPEPAEQEPTPAEQPPAGNAAAVPEAPPPVAPSLVQRWGPQAAVASGGLILIALVGWLTFRG